MQLFLYASSFSLKFLDKRPDNRFLSQVHLIPIHLPIHVLLTPILVPRYIYIYTYYFIFPTHLSFPLSPRIFFPPLVFHPDFIIFIHPVAKNRLATTLPLLLGQNIPFFLTYSFVASRPFYRFFLLFLLLLKALYRSPLLLSLSSSLSRSLSLL